MSRNLFTWRWTDPKGTTYEFDIAYEVGEREGKHYMNWEVLDVRPTLFNGEHDKVLNLIQAHADSIASAIEEIAT